MKQLLQIAACILALGIQQAAAHEFDLAGLQIIHPSIPATPAGATTAPVYLVIANEGAEDERLMAIETPFGPVKFLRPVEAVDGTVTMQELAWIDLPVGEIVTLVRGPMEMRGRVGNVTKPLLEGGELSGTMVFQKRGRYDVFFMIDPLELEEDPSTAPKAATEAERATDIAAIVAALRAEPGIGAASIDPIAISGDFAIAGWTQGETGARAFLRKSGDGWRVDLWSGGSLLLPASLTSFGVPSAQAEALRNEFLAHEAALGPAYSIRFDAFPGTAYSAKEPAE